MKTLAAGLLAALPLTANAATIVPTRGPAPQPQCGASGMLLGSALSPFALLSATTITNVGNSYVMPSSPQLGNDLMGVWPGTAVTGFYPPGLDASGPNAIYAAGYNANRAVPMAAQGALLTAYNSLALRRPTALVAGDLSQVKLPGYRTGMLPPGVYKSSSTLGIMAGNLTLSPGFNAAVPSIFIFQVASSLTTTGNAGAGGNVILLKGVNPCNVYWQVGDSATLGGAAFYGNVLAYSSITLAATNFTGRALAMNGAITLTAAGGSLVTNGGGF